jgi:hypothetical protein
MCFSKLFSLHLVGVLIVSECIGRVAMRGKAKETITTRSNSDTKTAFQCCKFSLIGV